MRPFEASEALLLPRPIFPISQFAPAGLVHTIRTLNPIHMQPPVQNKAIVRPPETVLVTLLPSKTQTRT